VKVHRIEQVLSIMATIAPWCDEKAESVRSLCDILIEAGSLMSQKVTTDDEMSYTTEVFTSIFSHDRKVNFSVAHTASYHLLCRRRVLK
jgi:hypothetical protein